MSQTKFAELIGNGDEQYSKRVALLESQARNTQEALINKIKSQRLALEHDLAKLTDLGVKNRDDLAPGEGFDPRTWASEVQRIKTSLYDVEVQLKIAEDTYNEFFTPKSATTVGS